MISLRLVVSCISCLVLFGPGFAGVAVGQVCEVFPADNIWNTPVDTLPLDSNSAAYVATIGTNSPCIRILVPASGRLVRILPSGYPM